MPSSLRRHACAFVEHSFVLFLVVGPLTILSGISLGEDGPAINDNDQVEKGDGAKFAGQLVREALCHEIYGRIEQRNELLAKATEANPHDPSLNWRKGKLFHDGQWNTIEQLNKKAKNDPTLNQYHSLKKNIGDTEAEHIRLAAWCAKNGLADRAEAHLQRVISINKDNPVARFALGHRNVNGQWMTHQQLADNHKQTMLELKRLGAWRDDLTEIAKLVAENSVVSKQQANKKLSAIREPSAVNSMEMLLIGITLEFDKKVVQHIGSIDALESVDSLSRIAVFHPQETVRKDAAEQLKSRDIYDFVPGLLEKMKTPWISGWQLAANPAGEIVFRQSFFQQQQDQNRVIDNDHLFQVAEQRFGRVNSILDRESVLVGRAIGSIEEIDNLEDRLNKVLPEYYLGKFRDFQIGPVNGMELYFGRQDVQQNGVEYSEAVTEAVMQAREQKRQSDAAIAKLNAQIVELNGRICAALRIATEEQLDNDPRLWWDWWDNKTEMYFTESKPVDYDRQTNTSYFFGRQYNDTEYGYMTYRQRTRYSCLVAGTMVETETGPVAIEKVRPGDKVLTKSIDSGKLEFQPVIQPTVRPAQPIFEIDLGTEIIKATGGHLFWVSGEGWVKTRDLESGMPIHTLDGVVAVKSLKQNGQAETHNLIVSGNSNYFVGNSRILSHDNSVRKPTQVVVPGLIEE